MRDKKMAREKLSGFRRGMAGFGKRLAYRTMKKSSFLFIIDLSNVVVDTFSDIYGSRSAGIKKYAEIIRAEAISVIADIIETPLLFGISMRSFLSKNLKDFAFIIELVFYTVLGEKWAYFVTKPEYLPAELSAEKVPKFIIKILHCPLCYNTTKEKEDASKLESGITHGTWFAKLLEGILQGLIDYVGLKYKVNCEETQCFLNGYDYGELTYTLYPIEK
jgi:predicted hydrocarbon binding protein